MTDGPYTSIVSCVTVLACVLPLAHGGEQRAPDRNASLQACLKAFLPSDAEVLQIERAAQRGTLTLRGEANFVCTWRTPLSPNKRAAHIAVDPNCFCVVRARLEGGERPLEIPLTRMEAYHVAQTFASSRHPRWDHRFKLSEERVAGGRAVFCWEQMLNDGVGTGARVAVVISTVTGAVQGYGAYCPPADHARTATEVSVSRTQALRLARGLCDASGLTMVNGTAVLMLSSPLALEEGPVWNVLCEVRNAQRAEPWTHGLVLDAQSGRCLHGIAEGETK